MAQDKVCNSCGGALKDDSVFCPSCGKSVEVPNEVDCPSCGQKNTQDSRYCDKCGSRIYEPDSSSVKPPLTRAQRIGTKRDKPKPNTNTTAEEIRRLRRLHEEMREEERSGALWNFIGFIVLMAFITGFLFLGPYDWIFGH